MKAEFERRNFHGAVVMLDWMPKPGGGNIRALAGTIDVLSDKELLGFEVNDRDSKWGVRVSGPSGTAIVVPGCKVHVVTAWPESTKVDNSDYWVLP